MLVRIFVLSSALVAVAIAAFLSVAENRDLLLRGGGYMESGEKYGVTVGLPTLDALKILKDRGYVYNASYDGGLCVLKRFPPGNRLDVMFDETWRKGSICVASKNGHVVGLEWAHGFPWAP
jgi:hypothetical protein